MTPTPAQYRAAIEPLLKAFIKGERRTAAQKALPSTMKLKVRLWGAWNEPDVSHKNPLYNKAARAAEFWEVAQSVVSGLSCKECRVAAGEFSQVNHAYIHDYAAALLCDPKRQSGCPPRYVPVSEQPLVWGLHDYQDVLYERTKDAGEFTHLVDTTPLEHPHVWLTEQGVELQNAKEVTRLAATETSKHHKITEADDAARQRRAAFAFLHLHDASPDIEMVNYYQYTAPTNEEHVQLGEERQFDSALLGEPKLDGGGAIEEEGEAREAYCVLAYTTNKCAPSVATGPQLTATGGNTHGVGACTIPEVEVPFAGRLDTNGSATKYYFEYGPTSHYGQKTPTRSLRAEHATVSVTIPTKISTTAEREGCKPMHFRLVAENAGGTSDGKDAQVVFVTNI